MTSEISCTIGIPYRGYRTVAFSNLTSQQVKKLTRLFEERKLYCHLSPNSISTTVRLFDWPRFLDALSDDHFKNMRTLMNLKKNRPQRFLLDGNYFNRLRNPSWIKPLPPLSEIIDPDGYFIIEQD